MKNRVDITKDEWLKSQGTQPNEEDTDLFDEAWENPHKMTTPLTSTMSVSTDQVVAQQRGYEDRIRLQRNRMTQMVKLLEERQQEIAALKTLLVEREAELNRLDGVMTIMHRRIENQASMLLERNPSGTVQAMIDVTIPVDPDPAEVTSPGDLTITDHETLPVPPMDLRGEDRPSTKL